MYGRSHGSTYEEVSSKRHAGPGSQLCGSLCCSLVGLAFFAGALVLVAHNERSTVCVQRALVAARASHLAVDCSDPGSARDGDLVFIDCTIAPESLPARAPVDFGAHWLSGAFNVTAVAVRQEVQMYQCVEKKSSRQVKGRDNSVKKVDSYSYSMQWSMARVGSDHFKAWDNDEALRALESGCGQDFMGNPGWQMEAQTIRAESLVAGTYDLSRRLGAVTADEPVRLAPGSYRVPWPLSAVPERRAARDGEMYTRREFIDYYGSQKGLDMWVEAAERSPTSGALRAESPASVSSSSVQTCQSPTVGCLRIRFYQSTATRVSHLAALSEGGTATRPWAAPASWMCGGSSSSAVDLFEAVRRPKFAEELIQNAESSNAMMTWVWRALGVVIAVAGVMAFLQPIQTIADLIDQFFDWFKFIPLVGWALDFLGDAVSGAVGWAIFAISIGVGLPSVTLVLGVAWCVMRPLVGVPLLAVSAMGLVYTVKAMVRCAKLGGSKRKHA